MQVSISGGDFMPAKNKNILVSVVFITLAVLACNLPGGAPATEEPIGSDTATPTFTPTASETPTPTASVTATVEACKPTLTTNTVANVRSGPGQVYGVIGSIPQGGTANVAGKNFDGTWWYIEFAGGNGGFAWIAGSVTTAVCIPSTLASIVAPPTPIVPTDVPSSTAVVAAPPPSITPGGIILIPIVPPIFIYKSPTPVLIKPIFPIPIGP
jgi:hypothetical protein